MFVSFVLSIACQRAPDAITGLDNLPGGNPLVPDVAMFPFPSDLYLADDASTPTGHRVAYAAEALPAGLPPEMFADADGFSRITPMFATLQGGIDPTSLPDPHDPGATLDVGASVLVAEADGALVPVLAELDRSTDAPGLQTLIVRPHRALRASTTHVVILRSSLQTADGGSHTPERAFVALRDGIPTDSDAVESLRDDFETVNAVIAELGLLPEDVTLAWSFTTRSEEGVLGPAVAMHDAMADAVVAPTITSDVVDGDQRVVEGTFVVPDFLGEDDVITLDGDGVPLVRGDREVPFVLAIPETVTEPRPVILFGHGFFASRYEPTWSSLDASLQVWRQSALAIDFLGFNEADQAQSFAVLGGDLSGLGRIVDQQRQSEAEFTALAHLVPALAAATGAIDPESVAYLGISNGGSQGLPILVASPVLTRGVLVVPGGGWSHMLQRAVQWNTLGSLLELQYPDPRELQLVMGLTQTVFDPVDAVNFAEHLTDDRLPGRLPMQATLHEAVGDCQVANLVTEWVARTADLPVVSPAPYPVWDLDAVTAAPPSGASVSSALFVYDEGYPALPEGNVPPPDDNGAHETIRYLDAYREQVGTFLESGRIVQVCDGACDPD